MRFAARHPARVVQRVDGPILLARGKDRELDDLTYQLNRRYAAATIIQSAWTFQRVLEMGYRPVNPVIINNASDPDIFHTSGRLPYDGRRKLRLISTSWSDNPRKGGPLYRWLEDHLDWDRFDYTFVGRASEPFRRIHQIDPVPSQELADLLRQHDIYVFASRNESCSNALIEALSCGLPALYVREGGNPELVSYGGLPFDGEADLLNQLDALAADLHLYQRLVTPPRLDEVVDQYLAVLTWAASTRPLEGVS